MTKTYRQLADRTLALKPEGAYFYLDQAQKLEAEGRRILHFEIGQPDFPTFENISRSGVRAIESGDTRYTPSPGILPLREAVAEAAKEFDCCLEPPLEPWVKAISGSVMPTPWMPSKSAWKK